jgi:hypothetical protein
VYAGAVAAANSVWDGKQGRVRHKKQETREEYRHHARLGV